MTWTTLGTVTPSFLEWRFFDLPDIGSQIFRVSFLGDIAGVNSYIYLRSYFYTNEVFNSIRLYPGVEKKIVRFEIPPEFQDRGINLRYLACRKFPRYRRFSGSYRDSAWQVQLEAFA